MSISTMSRTRSGSRRPLAGGWSAGFWARAGDRLSNLLFDQLRMSKEIQLHMWTSVLERVVELAGGRLAGGIEIRTRRVDVDAR